MKDRDYYVGEQAQEKAKECLDYLNKIEEEEITRRRKENAILRGIRKTREIDTHGERWLRVSAITQSYKKYCRESFIYRVLEFFRLR
jgi:hypothetical protein